MTLTSTELPPSPRPRRRKRSKLRILVIVCAVILAMLAGVAWWVVSGWRDTGTTEWIEDFNGPAGSAPNSEMWTVQVGGGGWGNNELQDYTRDSVVLDGEGSLAITAVIPEDGSAPTSGRLTTQGKWSFTYGTLSARIKLPEGPGLLPAFWLLGDSIITEGWPSSGEIDIVETPFATTSASQHVHGPVTSTEKWSLGTAVDFSVPLSEDFHVFTIERSPGRIVLSIDDQVTFDVSEEDMPENGEWVFDSRFHALFSLAVGGNWPGPPDETTAEVSTMLIDWIAFVPAPEDPAAQ